MAAAFSSLEIATLTMTVLCGAFLSTSLWDRRFMLYLPFTAILVALSLSRPWRPDEDASGPRQRPGIIDGFVWWALLLTPAMVVAKPLVTLWFMSMPQGIAIGDAPGLGYASCGTLFMGAWCAMLVCLIPWRRGAVAAGNWLAGTGRRPIVFGLLATEAVLIAVLMFRTEHTLTQGQTELAERIEEGETVLGHIAATVCMPLNVKTVRRALPSDPTPPPNLDVWDRLKPRYILEMTRRNFHPDTRLYKDLVEEKNYISIHRIEVGPHRKGVSRYEFELFERQEESPKP